MSTVYSADQFPSKSCFVLCKGAPEVKDYNRRLLSVNAHPI
jgi:hypothetical protein